MGTRAEWMDWGPQTSLLYNSYLASLDLILGFPSGSKSKESACNVGDLDLIPGLGRSPREGNGYPLQYSDVEHSRDYIVPWGHTELDMTEQLSLSSG